MNNIFKVDCQIEEIVCIAPGPSLTQEQCSMVAEAGKFTIVIGNAWRYSPYADILYHCDEKWWKHHKGVPEFNGDVRVSLEPVPRYPNIKQVLQSIHTEGMDEAPYVVTGRNSGYQSVNLAAHFKPKKIILIGFDMQDTGGKHNIDGDHPPTLKRRFDAEGNVKRFGSLADALETAGVRVYNCTLNTAITCFEKRDLADVL